jgi:hypothetical protein
MCGGEGALGARSPSFCLPSAFRKLLIACVMLLSLTAVPRHPASNLAITGLEYGQKAGRRVAVAVLISPLALFSKKRNHYLTITYNDAAGKEQAAVFELGKDVVRTTLKILEVRSGKSLEFQDDEARKSGLGGGE